MKKKVEISVPNKDFSDYVSKQVTITMKEDLETDGNIYFFGDIPQHVFDKLKDTSESYITKENGGKFTKRVKMPIFKYVVDSIQNVCYEAMKVVNDENLERDKVLLVKFYFSNTPDRHNWCGATMGDKIIISFQYFVAYRQISYRKKHFMDEEDSELISYSSMWSGGKLNVESHRRGKIQPLHQDFKHSEIENSFSVIPYTEDREKFLSDIQDSFDKVGNRLDSFLKDLNKDKLDKLIESNQKLIG